MAIALPPTTTGRYETSIHRAARPWRVIVRRSRATCLLVPNSKGFVP